MQDCIFGTYLTAGNGARGRPFRHLICCQNLSNSSQWNLLLYHSCFTSVQIPVNRHRGEFHRTTPHIDFVVINVPRLTYLWSNINEELLHQIFIASSNLSHGLLKPSSTDQRHDFIALKSICMELSLSSQPPM